MYKINVNIPVIGKLLITGMFYINTLFIDFVKFQVVTI